MTPTQRASHLAKLRDWLTRHDYRQDRYGHWQKTVADKIYRYKLSDVHMRKDVQVAYADGSKSWARLHSGLVSQISINPLTDKLTGVHT